ncbi:MAG: bifunctional D-glycero-beta-D-manno-heptose-7-phosphate kinase/D-glycero-beta-D-manno-heptose 1-phosphate adenylyltransferase HldE [Chromatiales bacterium]|jgi:D-beta-D-heptose 7-phosphate kinase/D-beta-D-heptose 1-phosphate adenosyltransferase|nr:bifunctional D-glycero-beta-D-manno-heptose-7-phosphate kinase/D-glycero-beta-D-manno-heptose 1-phosphate adenylyltransferase HldE [Chromatiales bacterium]MDX9765983.1 bifunctional D-glycero-beta-D-manno-heptose-7-phosphate kinase/D-glycero-beta-D-manno-heptose 1-phosphate adenylyltransferase HldE [Ectothiorhodospiraceae bacterium]
MQLPRFDAATVLVVGDLMLDRYWSGDTARISPEAPVPVVRVRGAEERPGGAGNVALNLAAVGARPLLVGLAGDDEAGTTLEHMLANEGVECRFTRVTGHPTITKLRVLSRHQQLIRLDFEQAFGRDHDAQLLDHCTQLLARANALVLSDYGKGTLGPARELIRAARAAGRPVLVDPKSLDFSHYAGATVVTPNLKEFEAVVGACDDEATLIERGMNLLAAQDFEHLLITRSEHGMTLLSQNAEPLHLPARAREVFDVTGAGDTVIAVLAAGVAAGAPMAEAAAIANLAAGIVVGKLGTATASRAELASAVAQQREPLRGVLNEAQLLETVADARARGERIVMTNGCFDLLHEGHVAYLEQARDLGDRLIVAVNDDASVRRLKGEGRPVNPLARRMAVLAGLAAVDWVLPFGEDTPERLICAVLPDVLVKGGDYRPEQIAGHDCVRRAGGEVKVLGFVEGVSTSTLIENIRRER